MAKRKVPSRRSQGVYYTPEWVVDRVVAGTMDPWFQAQKTAVGWTGDAPADAAMLGAYEARVRAVRVVDPACGSGAFLIGAFRRMLRERLEIDGYRRALPGAVQIPADEAAMTAEILDANIYGVDISAPAVEIAKLALWLHSARADAPLSSLDEAIRCGNSLVGPGFWADRPVEDMTPAAEERVNAFDWTAQFPFADAPGRFDIVLGNPPYVSVTNLRTVDTEVADYLIGTRGEDFYASTQTGRIDLYLPFIEKGLRLLRPGGRMGYIAPSLWTKNEQGEGLRNLIRQGRHLETWIDFHSHQIFNEADTYTALQFFTAEPSEAVAVASATSGEPAVAAIDWGDPNCRLAWDRLPGGDPWLMATGEERALIDRLAEDCDRLDDPAVTTGIIVGIQATLNYVYHLEKLSDGHYLCTPKDGDPQRGRPHTVPYPVEIEDEIMRPLVSGEEAKRYLSPETSIWLVFPYRRDSKGDMKPLPIETLRDQFPKALKHLSRWKSEFASSAKDDTAWWTYTYPKNLNVQDRKKLIVASTVPSMRVCADLTAEKYLDNVRVNGILTPDDEHLAYLLGVLNGPVADFVFRRIGKPKLGGWFEANKQFIAPLPIPRASAEDRQDIGERALELQTLHTRHRDLTAAAEARLAALGRRTLRDEAWLWPDLPDLETLETLAPIRLRDRAERRAWAATTRAEAVQSRCAALQVHLQRNTGLSVEVVDGEVRLISGGAPVLGVFLDPADAELVRAYWDWLILTTPAREAAALTAEMRRPPAGADSPPARQFIARVADLAAATDRIAEQEAAMNARLFDLYDLDQDERELVQAG